MGYDSEREKEIARIISEELDDPRITWAAIDAAAKRIFAGEATPTPESKKPATFRRRASA